MSNDLDWNRKSYSSGFLGLHASIEDKLKKKKRKCESCDREHYDYNPKYCRTCWTRIVAFKKSDISTMDKNSYEREERITVYLKNG